MAFAITGPDVVPTDAPGLSWTSIPAALSQPEHQFTVFFDERITVGREMVLNFVAQHSLKLPASY